MFENPSSLQSSLYLNAPLIGSGILPTSLVIKTIIPPTGEFAGFIGSSSVAMVMNGNNDDDIFTKLNQTVSLSIKSEYSPSGLSPLFIQKPVASSASLFIDSRIASGVSDLYVDGANILNSGMNLVVKTPENNNFNIFTRGFFD